MASASRSWPRRDSCCRGMFISTITPQVVMREPICDGDTPTVEIGVAVGLRELAVLLGCRPRAPVRRRSAGCAGGPVRPAIGHRPSSGRAAGAMPQGRPGRRACRGPAGIQPGPICRFSLSSAISSARIAVCSSWARIASDWPASPPAYRAWATCSRRAIRPSTSPAKALVARGAVVLGVGGLDARRQFGPGGVAARVGLARIGGGGIALQLALAPQRQGLHQRVLGLAHLPRQQAG
jgi:hypothetical protein